MAGRSLLHTLLVTGSVLGQKISTCNTTAPALAIAVSTSSSTGVDLFDYEAIQLTAEALKTLGMTALNRSDLLALVDFDDQNSPGANMQSGACRSFPADKDYPEAPVWCAFDGLLGGALIETIPIAASCYQSSGVYDATKCADVSERFTTSPDLHSDGTCTLGGYPSYSIHVKNVAQIQLGVNFARNNNLRLVIKNTGHDYIGKSSGAGALNIWTHNLKNIEFLADFASDEYTGPAFKAAAGVQGFEILEAARDNNVTILTGCCETVGWVGGYIAGGGHNPLASMYGMAADQVLAFEAVTADGRFVTASNTVNADLFWALRGGGGSAYAIVTSAIVKAYPKLHVTKSSYSFQAPPDRSTNFWKAFHAYFKRFPQYTDAGTMSYFWIWNYGTLLDFQMISFFAPNHTLEQFGTLTKPLFDDMKALNISFTPNTTFHDDFYSANTGAWGEDTFGVTNLRQATRLFPKSLWQTEEKFESFYNMVKNTVMSGHTVGGYHQAPGNPLNVSNAVNPAWRNAQSFLITANLVPDNATPEQLKNASDTLTFDIMAPWRKVAPNAEGGGVYLNEADIQELHWQAEFYGDFYAKLVDIKSKWDPSHVFYATTAVGSEAWEVRDGDEGVQTQNGRLCRL
ncbi:hypothetical protein ACEQ8H_008344 [Pleosporales sp. CAS-2024a]